MVNIIRVIMPEGHPFIAQAEYCHKKGIDLKTVVTYPIMEDDDGEIFIGERLPPNEDYDFMTAVALAKSLDESQTSDEQ